MIRKGLHARVQTARLASAFRPRWRVPLINHKLVAPGAAIGAALIAFVSIQVFGDPGAAGPRGVLALAPSDAAAEAPHVPFSVAVEAPDAYEQYNLTSERLPAAALEAPRPAAMPLRRAPFAGMTEGGPNGPLPIVAADGRTSAQAYARPFAPARGRPLIAVVISGVGYSASATTQAIEELPPEVTLSFAPYAENLQSCIDRARAHGHEVLIELPMEPFDPSVDDAGPQTLLAAAPAQQNISRLEQVLSRGTGYFGVTNYQGARFATSTQASQPLVRALRRRGLAFIASGIGQRTAFTVEAQRAGLPNTSADRIIDARRAADAVDDQLLNLEALALQNQSALGVGFAYPMTMEQVGQWARDINARGYQLAPASAVLNARAARR
jgi:hypothetical protein